VRASCWAGTGTELVHPADHLNDTMPMTRKAKLLMGVQSSIALITIGLAIARVANILQ